jgi:hypothetical protein
MEYLLVQIFENNGVYPSTTIGLFVAANDLTPNSTFADLTELDCPGYDRIPLVISGGVISSHDLSANYQFPDQFSFTLNPFGIDTVVIGYFILDETYTNLLGFEYFDPPVTLQYPTSKLECSAWASLTIDPDAVAPA